MQVQTFDVTELLTDGENELTVQLADGWYRGSCGAWGLKNQYGTETKLLAQLEITRADGSVQVVATTKAGIGAATAPFVLRTTRTEKRLTPAARPVMAARQKKPRIR